MQELDFPFEIKSIDEDEPGSFTGFASVYGNEDLHGDIVKEGAFDRTLKHNSEVTLLWQHDPREPIGKGTLRDTERGLVIDGSLNLDIEEGKRAHSHLKRNEIKGLSIGYDALEVDWKDDTRVLEEIRLWEVSLVTFPANPKAGVTNVKSVVSYQDLPTNTTEIKDWNPDAALTKVKRHFDCEDEPNSNYKNAFLWFDKENPEKFSSYKFLIADVIDGDLVVTKRALESAVKNIKNDNSIPEKDMPRVIGHLERYFEKMGIESPFKSSSVIMSDPKYERLLRKLVSQTSLKNIDARTNPDSDVITDSDVVLIKSAIGELEKLVEVRLDHVEEAKFLEAARTPEWEGGKENTPWGDVDLTMAAFWRGYIKHSGADEDPDEVPDWDEAPETFKNWSSQRSLIGEASADSFDEGVFFPVVNPDTDALNENGLEAANQRAPQADIPEKTVDSIQTRSVELLGDVFDRDIDESAADGPDETDDVDLGDMKTWLEAREVKQHDLGIHELIDMKLNGREADEVFDDIDWLSEKSHPDVDTFEEVAETLDVEITTLVGSTFKSGYVITDEQLESLGFEFDLPEDKGDASGGEEKDDDSEALHSLIQEMSEFAQKRVEGD